MRKQTMKATLMGGALMMSALVSQTGWAADDTAAKLDKLDDRLTELEVAKALSKIQFSGVMINRYEAFSQTQGVPGTQLNRASIRSPLTYFALNADVNVSKNLKLYTTVAFSKFWNQENRHEPPGYWQASEQGSFALSGSTPKFDRAYAAYTFDNVPLTLAMGRMPTNMGVPINQLDGLARQGTYPRLAFNGIFDGAAIVYNFSDLLPKNNHLVLRGFYTPWSNVSPTSRTSTISDVNGAGLQTDINSSTPQYVGLLEYNYSGFKFMDKIEFDYMIYKYDHFYWDGFSQDVSGTGVNTDPNFANPLITGRAQSLFLGTENIGKIGLNASVNALFYWSRYDYSQNVLMSSSYLLNLNERMDFLYRGWVVGGEYIHTDPNYYLDEWTYLNIIPFYQTPNSRGFHIYTAVPVVDHVIARVGYYHLHTSPYATALNPSFEANDNSVYGQMRIEF